MNYIYSLFLGQVFSIMFCVIAMAQVVGFPLSLPNLKSSMVVGILMGLVIFMLMAIVIRFGVIAKLILILIVNLLLASVGGMLFYHYCSTIASV